MIQNKLLNAKLPSTKCLTESPPTLKIKLNPKISPSPFRSTCTDNSRFSESQTVYPSEIIGITATQTTVTAATVIKIIRTVATTAEIPFLFIEKTTSPSIKTFGLSKKYPQTKTGQK